MYDRLKIPYCNIEKVTEKLSSVYTLYSKQYAFASMSRDRVQTEWNMVMFSQGTKLR